MTRLSCIISITLLLFLTGCNRPSDNYEHSATYGRVVEDNDAAYIPPEGYRPRVRPPRDNDAVYIPPRGRLARVPRPYPRDNDAAYIYPRGYKPGYMNGNGHGYPRDNDTYYTYPSGYDESDNDMLDIYPLYMD